jgi:hypothetical protein
MNKVNLNEIDSEEIKRIVMNELKSLGGIHDCFGWYDYIKPVSELTGVPKSVVEIVFNLFEDADLEGFENYDEFVYRG